MAMAEARNLQNCVEIQLVLPDICFESTKFWDEFSNLDYLHYLLFVKRDSGFSFLPDCQIDTETFHGRLNVTFEQPFPTIDDTRIPENYQSIDGLLR